MTWTGDMEDMADEIITRVQMWWMTCAGGTGDGMWFPLDRFLYRGDLCQNRPDAMEMGNAP